MGFNEVLHSKNGEKGVETALTGQISLLRSRAIKFENLYFDQIIGDSGNVSVRNVINVLFTSFKGIYGN